MKFLSLGILIASLSLGCNENNQAVAEPQIEAPKFQEICLGGTVYYWLDSGWGKTRTTALAPKWNIAPNGGNHLVGCETK